jgi:hypothetical protein
MRPCLVVLALLVLASTVFCQTQPAETSQIAQGHIVGTTVDDTGQVVPNAMICFGRYEPTGAESNCGPHSDEHGRFDIEVPLTMNRVFAEKPEGGYITLNNPSKPGVGITLSDASPVVHVVLKMGAKPAAITLNVSDGDTGKPVKLARISWYEFGDAPAQRYADFTGKYVMSIPSNRDVMVIVEAAGYKRWFYTDADHVNRPVVRMQPGESRTIDVVLEPENPQN